LRRLKAAKETAKKREREGEDEKLGRRAGRGKNEEEKEGREDLLNTN